MTTMKRCALGATVVLAAALGSVTVKAQTYPTRSITVILPFAGGSASDVVSRIMFDKMSKSLGQPIVVENRPGAGGNNGTAAGAKAAPDGYTLVATGSGPLAANKTLYRDLGYDPEKDFEPISAFAYFTIIVVASTKLPVNSLGEMIAYAKKQTDPLNYGSVGIGSSQHLAGAYFGELTGAKLTHVPYRNIAQYGPDLIAGTVQLGFQWYPNVAAPLQSGGAKALAIAGKKRMAALPDIPTTAEAGLPDYEASGWFSLVAPRGTPKPIVAKLHQALAAAIADPSVRDRFLQQGAEPGSPTPEETAQFFAAENIKWRDIIHKAGIPQIQ